MTTQHTDRELLELAAKAIGGRYIYEFRADSWHPHFLRIEAGAECGPLLFDGPWNPLIDDRDALRLAVKVDIHIEQNTPFKRTCALWYGKRVLREEVFEPWGDDKLAATRRAIVRAAAEIGKAMP